MSICTRFARACVCSMSVIPVVDIDESFIVLEDDEVITAVGVSSHAVVVGTRAGRLLCGDVCVGSLSLSVCCISVDGEYFCASCESEARIFGSDDLPHIRVSANHLPINCVSLSPAYHVSRRVVVGATGALLVYSHNGSNTLLSEDRGPVCSVGWREDFLVWSGPEFGVKIINAITGERICHLPPSGGLVKSYFLTNDLVLVQAMFTVHVLSASRGTVETTMTFPFDEFAVNLPGATVMSELAAAVSIGKQTILGFGLFDEKELSLTMLVAKTDLEIVHYVVDNKWKDLAVAEHVTEGDSWQCTAYRNNHMYLAIDNRLVRISKRSIADHCLWLIDHNREQEALNLADTQIINDPTLKQFIAEKCLLPLIEAEEFEQAATLAPTETVRWHAFLDLFLSLPTGPVLAKSLHAVLHVLPFPPRDQIVLPQCDYDKVINTLLRNVNWSAHDLLETMRRWPRNIYRVDQVQDALIDIVSESFVLTAGQKADFLFMPVSLYPLSLRPELLDTDCARQISQMLALKILFDGDRHEDSLDILLRLQCLQEIFVNLNSRILSSVSSKEWVEVNLLSLFQIDSLITAKFLAENALVFPKDSIVAQLTQPFFLHMYLREYLFLHPKTFHSGQIDLFIQFDQLLLPKFLQCASAELDLSQALEKIERANSRGETEKSALTEAQAWILWKLGRNQDAITLLMKRATLDRVVEFACTLDDEQVWRLILSKSQTPMLLAALIEAEKHGMVLPLFIRPQSVIVQLVRSGGCFGISNLVAKVITDLRCQIKIESQNLKIIAADYSQQRKRNTQTRVLIEPTATPCRLCGFRLCAPSPGANIRTHELLEIIPGVASENRFDSIGSALAVIDSSGLCHSKCLLRTSTI